MVFASQLAIARKNKHLSQEKLAEHLDVTRQAVAKWENGDSVPDINKLIQIADFFNMSIDALVRGDDCVESEMVVAKRIYRLFADAMESYRTWLMLGRSNVTFLPEDINFKIATLRSEIGKSRLVFPKKVVDSLFEISSEMGECPTYIANKQIYEAIYAGISSGDTMRRCELYIQEIYPQKYEQLEALLKDYLMLP